MRRRWLSFYHFPNFHMSKYFLYAWRNFWLVLRRVVCSIWTSCFLTGEFVILCWKRMGVCESMPFECAFVWGLSKGGTAVHRHFQRAGPRHQRRCSQTLDSLLPHDILEKYWLSTRTPLTIHAWYLDNITNFPGGHFEEKTCFFVLKISLQKRSKNVKKISQKVLLNTDREILYMSVSK